MKHIDWSRKGISIHGSCLSNLRFTYDILSEASTGDDEFYLALKSKHGLELKDNDNFEKPVQIQGNLLEYISNVYLGKQIYFEKSRHLDFVERRVKIIGNKFWAVGPRKLKSDQPYIFNHACCLVSLKLVKHGSSTSSQLAQIQSSQRT